MLSSHVRLGVPSIFFDSRFYAKAIYEYMNSSAPHSYYISSPSHPPCYDHVNKIWGGIQIMKLVIMQSLHPTAASSLSGAYIFRINVFSNTLSVLFLHYPPGVFELWLREP
jgi:hypothetical protein